MIGRLLSCVADAIINPLGWRTVLLVETEIRDDRMHQRVGTYTFELQCDRLGRRRSRVGADGNLAPTPGPHIHGQGIADRWVRLGLLPA